MKEIEGCVCRDRQNSYGDAEDNFDNIAKLASVVLQRKLSEPLTALDVAMFSQCIKLARTVGNPLYLDNHIDSAGYAVCAAGIVKSILEKQASNQQYANIKTLGEPVKVDALKAPDPWYHGLSPETSTGVAGAKIAKPA